MKYKIILLGLFSWGMSLCASDYREYVPEVGPRTWILAGQKAEYRAYCSEGDGQIYAERLKEDFDAYWASYEVPSQPSKYGDPDPRKRTGDKVKLWRGLQDTCNQISTVAEAATLLWILTEEEVYLNKAKAVLLAVANWDADGSTDIYYNDEAHFRLWRKLPGVYDQIRDSFTAAERATILADFARRGRRSVAWIKESGIKEVKRNSVEAEPSSHPVRFMAMTGVSGLALWDDLPEAKEWFAFAYDWYRDVFTPWGGDDGGWAEGPAYWRGVYEHAVFQDALKLIGDPLAYSTPFWKNTGYFQVYFVQPYYATSFGDLSNAGKFNMEPSVWHFLRHLSKVLHDGYLLSYTDLYSDMRDRPLDYGLNEIWRGYPNYTEYLIRDFLASLVPEPERKPLSDLPGVRHFEDVGWVSFHSNLGEPEKDIQLSFKSSPYGSFSHSHGDQNAFILNAYGANLAINSGYREYHRSQHHKYYTRQTKSKNGLLIDMRGQDVQNKAARGAITGFEEGDGYAWARGEAKEAYQILQPLIRIESVQRDIVMVDHRYFVIRDRVKGNKPFNVSWLLHAERPIIYNTELGRVQVSSADVHLGVVLKPIDNKFRMQTWSGFEVPVDSDYVDPKGVAERPWMTAPNVDQFHFRSDILNYGNDITIYSVLYPTQKSGDLAEVELEIINESEVEVQLPNGGKDRVQITETGVRVNRSVESR